MKIKILTGRFKNQIFSVITEWPDAIRVELPEGTMVIPKGSVNNIKYYEALP
jgi:hypothetical protein